MIPDTVLKAIVEVTTGRAQRIEIRMVPRENVMEVLRMISDIGLSFSVLHDEWCSLANGGPDGVFTLRNWLSECVCHHLDIRVARRPLAKT